MFCIYKELSECYLYLLIFPLQEQPEAAPAGMNGSDLIQADVQTQTFQLMQQYIE